MDKIKNLYEYLNSLYPDRIRLNEPMKEHTSMRTGGNADLLFIPENTEELKKVLLAAHKHNVSLTILGNGTNVLVRDGGIEGIVIVLNKLKQLTLDGSLLTALCGNSMAETARAAMNASLSGCEFMAGIPGSVGGGVYMNAGAYGGEIKDIIESASSLDECGNIHTYTGEELELGYRSSIFTERNEIILCASFRLIPGERNAIIEKIQELNQKRKDKQPLEYPSAGSTFKRPEGYYAAALIDEAGLKGKKVGGAMVSEKHAGFIINADNATSLDVLNLIELVKKEVEKYSGVKLEPEIKIIGRE